MNFVLLEGIFHDELNCEYELSIVYLLFTYRLLFILNQNNFTCTYLSVLLYKDGKITQTNIYKRQ